MFLGTGLHKGSGAQWHRVQGLDERALAGVSLDGFISVFGFPHGDHLLAGFVALQWAKAILIKIKIN